MSKLDRFSVRTIVRDFWFSLTIYGKGTPDVAARVALLASPPVVAVGSFFLNAKLSNVSAILPAVSLMAAVLLSVGSQVISLRDKVKNPTDRVRRHFRETISGLLLAALVALVSAVLLGVTGSIDSKAHATSSRVFTALSLGAVSYLALTFFMGARRLYATYLQVYEKGLPLPPPSTEHKTTDGVNGDKDSRPRLS